MNRRLFDSTLMSRNGNDDGVCENCSETDGVKIPDCIDTDYCVSAPRDMNDGILTLAFVDMQPLDSVYRLDTAFCNGTLFPNIDKPFYGGRKQ